MATEQINQELEDAAEYYYPTDNGQWAHPAYKDAFKKGANWKAEQVANDAIEFFNWVKQEYREFHTIMENNKPVTSYVHRSNGGVPSRIEKLYELWQQTRNK